MGVPVNHGFTHTASPPPLPANVAQAASGAYLGAFERVYVPQRRSWFALIFLLILGLATIIVLVGFWLLWLLVRTPNVSRSQAARRVYLFEQGFIVANRPDDVQVYRWDGIDTVYQKIVSQRTYGIETARTYLYTITSRDGRTAKLDQFWADIAELGPQINNRVSAALLPGSLAAVQRGQAVRFADLTVNAGGIAGRRKSVTWAEVKDVEISGGYVRVGVAGKFLPLSNTAAANISNLPLFFALVNRLRTGRL
jgi:hypothetical protein